MCVARLAAQFRLALDVRYVRLQKQMRTVESIVLLANEYVM